MRRLIGHSSKTINYLALNMAILFFATMLIIVLFQIVARYIFQAPPPWTAEAARYCMVWGGMLGATVAFYRDEDPRLFSPPRKGRGYILYVALGLRILAVVLFLGPVLYYSDRFLFRSARRTTEVLDIPAVFVTSAVPLAVVIILFHQIAKMLNYNPKKEREEKMDNDNRDR